MNLYKYRVCVDKKIDLLKCINETRCSQLALLAEKLNLWEKCIINNLAYNYVFILMNEHQI